MNNQTPRKTDGSSGLIPHSGSPELSQARSASGYEALGLELLLYELQSPINIGTILRIAEAYHFKVSILDPHGVLEDPQKLPTVKDFACGAISRRDSTASTIPRP